MNKNIAAAILAGMSLAAEAKAQEQGGGAGSPWGLGAAIAVVDSPYAGEGARTVPIPLITYHSDRLQVRGLAAGWRLAGDAGMSLSLLGRVRLDGFDAGDLGRSELARNGVDRDLLDDRDMGFDIGIGLKWKGLMGQFSLDLVSDVSGRSKGREASLEYGRPIALGRGRLTPSVGMTWQSAEMGNFYYGTSAAEVQRGGPAYSPGAVRFAHVGVNYLRSLNVHWSVSSTVRYVDLPDKVRQSPLIESGAGAATSVFVGISRSF